MVDRRSLAIGVLVAFVAMSHVLGAEGQGAGAAPGPAAGAPQGRGAGAPQGRGAGGGGFGRGTAFTPEPGAKDLKSVLYNWTWHMGMLRSGNESELVKTLDYHAESGTIQVDGQPCTLTKYHV